MIFSMMGAAAAAANLLWEFNIAEKKDAKLTKSKKGKVILVKVIVRFNFSVFSINPGAIKKTNKGMNISMSTITKTKNTRSKLNILFAKSFALVLLLLNSDE